MRQNQNAKRGRGRSRKPNHQVNRAFDSNGPEVKIRGSASQIFEKYQALARDAHAAGDRIGAENYLQHAEHYFRLLNAMQSRSLDTTPTLEAASNAESDDDGDSEQVEAEAAEGADDQGERIQNDRAEDGRGEGRANGRRGAESRGVNGTGDSRNGQGRGRRNVRGNRQPRGNDTRSNGSRPDAAHGAEGGDGGQHSDERAPAKDASASAAPHKSNGSGPSGNGTDAEALATAMPGQER